MPLRDYQTKAAQEMLHLAQTNPGGKGIWASPTGSGKTAIALAAQHMICEGLNLSRQECVIISPTYEIIKRGFLAQIGVTPEQSNKWSDAKLQTICYQKYGIVTPLILKNRLSGKGNAADTFVPPKVIIADEGHRSLAATYDLLDLYAGEECTWLGVTATPFRGSPEETVKFRQVWGPPHIVLTLKEAQERGYISFPEFKTVPLVDDAVIEIKNGEFVTQELDEHLTQFDRLRSLCDLVRGFAIPEGPLNVERFDRPTMLVVPSRRTAQAVSEQLGDQGVVIDGDTPKNERVEAYENCRLRRVCLITIAVVGEGVDLPWLRRIIDARPTVSPVAIMQLYGRCMRPTPAGEAPPQIICVCRNLLRHGYLFEGMIPRQVIAKSAQEFPPSERHEGMWLGLENISKFKKLTLPLEDGTSGSYYLLESIEELKKTQWAVITTPYMQKPLVASRTVEAVIDKVGDRKWVYGKDTKWQEDSLPSDFVGFGTSKYRKGASPAQRKVWRLTARIRGLDPEYADGEDISGRDMEAFFAIAQTRGRI